MHKNPKKLERGRGSTLLTTVLVSIVAATIGMVSIQVSLVAGTSELNRLEVNQSRVAMDTGLARVAATLEHNPFNIFLQVLPDESDRLCYLEATAPVVVAAGAPWPADCGPVWGYAASEYSSGVHIKPPSSASTLLEVRAFGRAGEVIVGQKETYSVLGHSAPSLYSGTSLDTGATGFDNNEYGGIVYSYDEAVVANESMFAQGSIVAAEKRSSLPVTESCLLRCTYALNGPESDTTLDVRNVYKVPMSPGGLDGSITVLKKIACLDQSPIIINGQVTALCLRPGATLVDAEGATSVMPDAEAVLVTAADSPDQISIYRTASASVLGNSETDWVLVGTFLYPASGILYSDYTTRIGICMGKPQGCIDSFPKGLTLVAGSPENRKDITLGSSVQGYGLGVVASGGVKISVFSGVSNVSISAAVLAAGKPNESLLATVTQSPAPGSSLTLTGQLILSRYEVTLSGFAAKTHSSSVGLAPFFPAPLVKYMKINAVPLSADSASSMVDGSTP